jgi:hypothetical protein
VADPRLRLSLAPAWVFANSTFWIGAGVDWDEQKVMDFLEIGAPSPA